MHMWSLPVPCILPESYNYHKANSLDDAGITFDTWYVQGKAESPQLLHWCTCLELEILVFTFVQPLCIGDWLVCWITDKANTLVLQSQPHKLCKVDTYPCERQCSLDVTHPYVGHEFRNGKFVMVNTQRPFSLIATDQGHEQNNATKKGDSGINGLTEDHEALLCWALAGPDTRVISESIMGTKPAASETRHHGQKLGYQMSFKEHIADLVHVMKDLGNPFDEESSDLIWLHARDIMHKSSACRLCCNDPSMRLGRVYVIHTRKTDKLSESDLRTHLEEQSLPIQWTTAEIHHQR